MASLADDYEKQHITVRLVLLKGSEQPGFVVYRPPMLVDNERLWKEPEVMEFVRLGEYQPDVLPATFGNPDHRAEKH